MEDLSSADAEGKSGGKRPRAIIWYPVLLVLLSFWLYYPILDFLQLGFEDEGEILHAGHRVFQGQFPNRDFFVMFPPLSYLIPVFSWTILGESLFAARLPLLFLIGASAVLLFDIGRRLLSERVSALAAALFVTEVTKWPVWSQNWSNVPFVLLACRCLILHVEKRARSALFVTGLVVGLCFLNTPQAGVITLVLGTIVAFTDKEWRDRAVSFGTLLLGTATVLGIFLLIYALNGALQPMLEDQWSVLLSQYPEFNKIPYEIFPDKQQLSAGLETVGNLSWAERWQVRQQLLGLFTWPLVTLLSHSLYYPVVLISFLLAFHQWWTTRQRIFCIVAVGQLGLCFHTFFRPDAAHLAYSRSLWWILLLFLLQKFLTGRPRVVKGLVLTPLVVAILAVSVQAGLRRKQWTGAQYQVVLARDTLRVSDPRVGNILQNLQRFLNDKTKPGDKIFIYPWNALLYILMARDNIATVDRLLPIYTPQRVFESVFQELKHNDEELKLILLFSINFDLYLAQYPNVPPELFKKTYLDFENRLKERFSSKVFKVQL